MLETFVSTRLLCNNQCRQRNFYTAGYTTAAWVVQSKGRQQEPTAPTAARLIGCGGRAAAAAAAAAVGYTTTTRFFTFFLVRNNSVPAALLRARYTAECVVVVKR